VKTRIQSVDALRGLVMIIMALDHVRDFVNAQARLFQPEDLARTTAALFFTRWITHFCAPVFMFTAGLGAFFWMSRGRTKAELSRFLWTRGLWLVVLELTVLRLAMNLDPFSGLVLLSILWALGWCMVALGFLARLPLRVLAVISVASIALHNLFDGVQAARFGGAAWVWNIVHQQGIFRAGSLFALVAYPLVPWIFVMSAGYCFGAVFLLEPPRRRQWMARAGLALTLAFLAIRWLNIYGDPAPWASQPSGAVMTVVSFLRCTKYPPSLDFLLMTLGPALLVLAWFDRLSFANTNPLIVFGRVPLFYFLGHFFLAHSAALAIAWFGYGRVDFVWNQLPSIGAKAPAIPAGFGFDLAGTYAVWIAVVIVMYPACLWFARLKERRRDWWLSYL
jgi:uncharacterized membrane protein